MIPETNLLDYLKQVLLTDAFKAFLRGSILTKAVFCFGQKRGMLVNDECSSWYKRGGIFCCQYDDGLACEVSQTNSTP